MGLIVFIFITLMNFMNFWIIVTNKMACGESISFKYPFINEMTGGYTMLVLIPFLIWFFNRFRINRRNIHTHIPLYLSVSIIFGGAHTTLMWLSRKMIYRLARLGDYDYGQMGFRLLMEYNKQFLSFCTIFAIILLFRYIQKNHEQKLKTVQLEQQLTKARLQALQMQLNPHFLFNTLNLISATMYEDVKAADNMIANLSDLLRLTLKNKNDKEYTLKKELDLLRIYLDIMKERFKDKLVVRTDINNETLNAVVPGFILQPLVENSIVYNMESLKKTRIEIISRKEKNRLKLMVIDNGPGISGEMNQIVKNGVGLSNTIERLEKLYENNYHFHIQNITDGGLQVVIDIPFSYSSSEKYDNEKH
jgi:sensor histidine kinase YesM